ncbi:MAG: DUF3552 domain-containing protein, partial [Saprospiraceae bacterium]|nr:DUF3552 domain-containing protein [Saprospiraceae bacterium]
MNTTGIGIGIAIGVIVGAIVGYLLIRLFSKNAVQSKVEEMNAKADQAVKEARLSAKRIIDEAETKSEKIISQAEIENEKIKQRKIQEAKEKFNRYRSEFESEKSNHVVEMKEREMMVKSMESELRQKEEKFDDRVKKLESQRSELEQKESDIKAIRENLDLQLKVVSKKKEELDAANDLRIRELEKVAALSQQEAKEQLLEAIKGKAETEAMALIKDTIEQAKATANKEAKKIVIQTIQRMCAEYTIENTVSVFNLDSDDLKGQIIGREGRNIRALEAATGAEIIVDD